VSRDVVSQATVAILSANAGEPVGAGVVLGDLVITCSHVIREAGFCGTEDAQDAPRKVRVLLPGPDRHECIATVETLLVGDDTYDIAVLKVENFSSSSRRAAIVCVPPTSQAVEKVTLVGFPDTDESYGRPLDAELMRADLAGQFQLRPIDARERFSAGDSGAGVFGLQNELRGIVVTMAHPERAVMLPIDIVFQRLRSSGMHSLPALLPAITSRYAHVKDVLRYCREKVASDYIFDVRFSLCNGTDEIFEIHRTSYALPVGDTPTALFENPGKKAIYLMAPGGSGKTSFLFRYIERAIEDDYVAFLLVLTASTNRNRFDGEADSFGVRRLFDAFSQEGGNFDEFEKALSSPDVNGVAVIVDGLNENVEDTERIRAVIEYMRRTWTAKLRIVVADRVSQREIPTNFALATIRPLSLSEVESALDPKDGSTTSASFRDLLTIPFFLKVYLDVRRERSLEVQRDLTRATLLLTYFSVFLGAQGRATVGRQLSPEAMKLADLAFASYQKEKLTIDEGEFAEAPLLKSRAQGTGVIVPHKDGGYVFRHQLMHDFLAGWHLVQRPSKEWTPDDFDAITLRGHSFDAVELAFELLSSGEADRFLMEVYDWNYRAALECVGNLSRRVAAQTMMSEASLLTDALFAINSEKRFDRFSHTRKKANRDVTLATSPLISRVAKAETLLEIVEAVRELYKPGESQKIYLQWRELFLCSRDAGPSLWAYLQDSSLLGWTAANVFKRSECSKELTDYLISLYQALWRTAPDHWRARTARWRVVHALGRSTSEEAAELLLGILKEAREWRWTMLGAARSLVEISSYCPSETDTRSILTRLAHTMPTVMKIKEVAFELRQVALLAESAPHWWAPAYLDVLRRGQELADSSEKHLWSSRMVELGNVYASAHWI
jgi:hypothetical protein